MRRDPGGGGSGAVYDNYVNALEALEGAGDRVRSMHSWLVASLCAPDGKELGLIQAFDKRDGEFTHLDEEVLVQLAQMAAAAVERAQR